MSSNLATERGRLGGLIATHAPPEKIIEARRDLAAAHDERAVDDPAQLARAARIVRIALARGIPVDLDGSRG